MNKRKTTALLIAEIHANLDELCSESDDFALGQRYAYLECLEILQLCPAFRRPGIAYDTERRYSPPPKGGNKGGRAFPAGTEWQERQILAFARGMLYNRSRQTAFSVYNSLTFF